MEEITGSNRPNPWRWLFDPRSNKQIEDEIAEELQLHFDLMVESEMQHGKEEVEAKEEATERFGDLEKYASECKQIQTWERMMLQKIQVGLVTVLIVLLALSYLDSRNLASQLSSIESQLSAFQEKETTLAELEENVLSKVDDPEWMEIFVCDEAGKPIAGADVQVEWCNLDRNNHRYYLRQTNEQGFLYLIRDETVVIEALQANKEGMNFERRVMAQSRQDYIEQQKMQLKPTAPIRVGFVDRETKKPIAGATIQYTAGRYAYSRKEKETDANGYIDLNWFTKGEAPWVHGKFSMQVDEEELNGAKNVVKKFNGDYLLVYSFNALIDINEAIEAEDYKVQVELMPYNRGGGGGFGGGGGGLGGGGGVF